MGENDQYWDKDNVKLNQVNWYCVAENATAATMFDNGQLDVSMQQAITLQNMTKK